MDSQFRSMSKLRMQPVILLNKKDLDQVKKKLG